MTATNYDLWLEFQEALPTNVRNKRNYSLVMKQNFFQWCMNRYQRIKYNRPAQYNKDAIALLTEIKKDCEAIELKKTDELSLFIFLAMSQPHFDIELICQVAKIDEGTLDRHKNKFDQVITHLQSNLDCVDIFKKYLTRKEA